MLPTRTTGKASFPARELAKMRVMMKLRELGLPLKEAHRNAEIAAASVVYAALHQNPASTIGVEGPGDLSARYLDEVAGADSDAFSTLADVLDLLEFYQHAIIQNGQCDLVPALHEHILDETAEVAGIINLSAVATSLTNRLPRPFFVLTMPKGYKTKS